MGSVCKRWRGRVEAGTGPRGGHTEPDECSMNAVDEGPFRIGPPPPGPGGFGCLAPWLGLALCLSTGLGPTKQLRK